LSSISLVVILVAAQETCDAWQQMSWEPKFEGAEYRYGLNNTLLRQSDKRYQYCRMEFNLDSRHLCTHRVRMIFTL